MKSKRRKASRRLSIESLRQVCSPPDLHAIANLAPPSDSYKEFTADELGEAGSLLISVWKMLLFTHTSQVLSRPIAIRQFGMLARTSGDDAIGWLLFILCQHYDAVLVAVITRVGIQKPLPAPGIEMDFLLQASKHFEGPRNTFLSRAAGFTYDYLVCLWSSLLLTLMHIRGARSTAVLALEEVAHDTATRLVGSLMQREKGDIEWRLRVSLAHSAFRIMNFAYHMLANRPKSVEKKKSYLSLNVHELSLLAGRDTFATEKYGLKRIEKEFEQQLSLLFQSLGFFVIAASPGERTVDLICVPTTPEPLGVLLVDGKTSTHPYALPVSDQRALIEYVERIRRTGMSLPRVTDVLLVGPKAAPGLIDRLRRFQAEINAHVRYCPAELLEDLREALMGTVNQAEFIQALRLCTGVVDKQLIDQLIAREQSKSQAVTDLVRTFVGDAPKSRSRTKTPASRRRAR
jgi:hypothetical protein